MAEVIVINPTKTFEPEQCKTRVAAYIRVSSDSEDQENSFINQYDYYNTLISGNPEWTYADIYADNGISGTEMIHRDEFNRMYSDCLDGKIDCIITKSISRFARNTYDCIDTIRKLKALGVDVIFERENINTKNMNSEVELAALSSMAQEESISLSKNVRMGIKHRMMNGTFKQGCIPYGYIVENDVWKINEEQARVVRAIFQAYINGKSLAKIADELKKAGITKADGTANWTGKRIAYILRNEKYKGDALYQKSYTEDFPFKARTNRGERDMYYVKNHNIPIVPADIFDKANALLDGQRKRYYANPKQREHILSKMIYCEECQTMFRRKSGEITVHWVCRAKNDEQSGCPTPQVAEQAVFKGFVKMYNRLYHNIEYILAPMLGQLQEFRTIKLKIKGEIEHINRKIAELTEQIHVLGEMKANGYIESALFIEKSNEMASQITGLRKDKKMLLGNDETEKVIRITERLIQIIRQNGPIGEFEEKIFKKTVNRIWVDKEKNLKYEMINGLTLVIPYREVN